MLSFGVYVQLKAWEEYTLKLEEKYVALMTEHESFQRELASVRGILDDGTDPEIHGNRDICTCNPKPYRLEGICVAHLRWCY